MVLGAWHAPASSQTSPLKACKLDEAYEPISLPDREAPGERIIQQAVQNLGRSVLFDPQPWGRCLDGIRSDVYQLIVGPSANPAFYSFIAYPRLRGEPDPRRGIGTVNYMVLRKRGAAVDWDGRRFTRLTQPVYYGNTAVIVRRKLDAMNVQSDDSARHATQLAQMLLFDRIEAAITRQNEAESLLTGPEFAGLEILPRPFVSFEAYLGGSMQLAAGEGPFLENLWNEVARLRSMQQPTTRH